MATEQAPDAITVHPAGAAANRLLACLGERDAARIAPILQRVTLIHGQVLFEAGDDVAECHFPCGPTMLALIVALPDGTLAETANVGCEGALGGIVSQGHKPAFARAVVQVGGPALRVQMEDLDRAKTELPALRDLLSRYADCLIAQVLQSVACNALHDLSPRLARWLLTVQDRTGEVSIPLTQEFLATMLGVQRTTVQGALADLQDRGLLTAGRARIMVTDRAGLEAVACECYDAVLRHFESVLPGVYPREGGT